MSMLFAGRALFRPLYRTAAFKHTEADDATLPQRRIPQTWRLYNHRTPNHVKVTSA